MVAEAAAFAVEPPGFLDALGHYKIRFLYTGFFNGVVHGLEPGLIGFLGKGMKTAKDQTGKQ